MKPRGQRPARPPAANPLGKLGPALDRLPAIITLAGPSGAGKSTFYQAFLKPLGLRYLNADILARELKLAAYPAAQLATILREEFLRQKESFIFEKVFSDPAGEKLAFLNTATQAAYNVVLCYIGLSGPSISEERVALRVSQGGHDVPTAKLASRYPRTLANLKRAIAQLPCVLVYDNDDLRDPFRLIATYANGQNTWTAPTFPAWFARLERPA